MSSTTQRTPLQLASIVAGPAAAVLVAWLLSLTGDSAGSGVTQANVALVMAALTVGVAVVDWSAGVTTSIVAALALNFFHTEPYRTLRVTDRRDVYSIVLLGTSGLLVSAVTAMRVRRGVTTLRRLDADLVGDRLDNEAVQDRPAPELWAASIAASTNDLSMVLARVERTAPSGLPVIARRTTHDDDPTLVLPAVGATIHLRGGEHGRWLVLTPRPRFAPLVVDRRAVLALADAIDIALRPRRLPADA